MSNDKRDRDTDEYPTLCEIRTPVTPQREVIEKYLNKSGIVDAIAVGEYIQLAAGSDIGYVGLRPLTEGPITGWYVVGISFEERTVLLAPVQTGMQQ